MDNPEKLAALGTQDKRLKHTNKNKIPWPKKYAETGQATIYKTLLHNSLAIFKRILTGDSQITYFLCLKLVPSFKIENVRYFCSFT
jgi:hypothetical protein